MIFHRWRCHVAICHHRWERWKQITSNLRSLVGPRAHGIRWCSLFTVSSILISFNANMCRSADIHEAIEISQRKSYSFSSCHLSHQPSLCFLVSRHSAVLVIFLWTLGVFVCRRHVSFFRGLSNTNLHFHFLLYFLSSSSPTRHGGVHVIEEWLDSDTDFIFNWVVGNLHRFGEVKYLLLLLFMWIR